MQVTIKNTTPATTFSRDRTELIRLSSHDRDAMVSKQNRDRPSWGSDYPIFKKKSVQQPTTRTHFAAELVTCKCSSCVVDARRHVSTWYRCLFPIGRLRGGSLWLAECIPWTAPYMNNKRVFVCLSWKLSVKWNNEGKETRYIIH